MSRFLMWYSIPWDHWVAVSVVEPTFVAANTIISLLSFTKPREVKAMSPVAVVITYASPIFSSHVWKNACSKLYVYEVRGLASPNVRE